MTWPKWAVDNFDAVRLESCEFRPNSCGERAGGIFNTANSIRVAGRVTSNSSLAGTTSTRRSSPDARPGGGGHRMTSELAALTVWLPVTIVNGLNHRGHWVTSMRRARAQRAAVVVAVLEELHRQKVQIAVPAMRAKCIQFEAHIGRAFDEDGLQAALKHVRDGLIDARLIDGDGPQDGHVFRYRQCPGTPRMQRGVVITIQLRDAPTPGRRSLPRVPLTPNHGG
jgi:hypothetical protein